MGNNSDPLFNEGDRYTNQVNSDALRALGCSTFLPQEVIISEKSGGITDTMKLSKCNLIYKRKEVIS